MHKNIVSNNLREFVLGLEQAVKEGYSVVEESVDFNAGYFRALTQKEYSPENVKVVLNGEEVGLKESLPILSEILSQKGEESEKIFADLVSEGSEVELGVHQVGVLKNESEFTEDMGLHNAPSVKPKRSRK